MNKEIKIVALNTASQVLAILVPVLHLLMGSDSMSVFPESVWLYTPMTEALMELRRRRANKELQQKVKAYFASHPCMPELLREPRAIMAPTLVSPNFELNYFLDLKKELPIRNIFYEFSNDKFVHLNFEKYCLGQMTFFRKNTSGSREITGSVRVVDFEKDQGKPMNEINTIWGENFVKFHHRLTNKYLSNADIEIYDFSEWFRKSRLFAPELPYLRYLGLFITDGILFSNFISNFVAEEDQSFFTNAKVLPAFRRLREIFGVSPLIVPIEPLETDERHFWCYYSEEIRQLI